MDFLFYLIDEFKSLSPKSLFQIAYVFIFLLLLFPFSRYMLKIREKMDRDKYEKEMYIQDLEKRVVELEKKVDNN